MEAVALAEKTRSQFDASYDVLFGELAGFCRALGAGPDAEDIAQETLIVGRRHLADLREAGSLRPWLRRIAVRAVVRSRRRPRAQLIEDGALLPNAPDLGLDAAAAISRLPDRERMAVVLVYGMGFHQDEVAELLGVRRGTVAASLWKARRRLARDLADYGPEVEP
jgi:RNA polymerase sigma-70 factor (ECF subfamily)